ncbi:MAG: type II toxin-antitoxin system VapC family toxin [Stellaceae bacterium]
MIVLDTNVLSETLRDAPAPQVRRWLEAQPRLLLYSTAITEAELLYGVERLSHGRRRRALAAGIAVILDETLAGRILPFDSSAARMFAEIVAGRQRAGRPISHADAQIAAIARANGADLATRNIDDFILCGIALIDPWRR